MLNHTEDSKRVGRNLRKIRSQKGLMQIDVAVGANLNRSYISKIEMGKARVTIALICQLVKGLEITSNELIADEEIAYARYLVYEGGDNSEMG